MKPIKLKDWAPKTGHYWVLLGPKHFWGVRFVIYYDTNIWLGDIKLVNLLIHYPEARIIDEPLTEPPYK